MTLTPRVVGGLLFAVLLLLTASGAAEPALVVNGRVIVGNTTSLVSGSSYAPGAALAQALGAALDSSSYGEIVMLEAGGRVLQLRVVREPAAASRTEDAVWLDGRSVPGSAALVWEGELFLPVKPVAEALGASVTYLNSDDTVMVVQPRARLTALTRRDAGGERVEISVSGPVRYSTFYNEPLATLHLYLERTDIDLRLPPVEGDAFTMATASASGGASEVRVQLLPGTTYNVYAVPEGRGFRLNVTFGSERQPVASERLSVVLDAGHGGPDAGIVTAGFGTEASLTLAFSERLRTALISRGMRVELTRDADVDLNSEQRSRGGIGADIYLSIHSADLPLGEFRAYYLGDASNVHSLEMAVRENAAAELRDGRTDELRRELLLGLVTDLDVGRRLAEGLAGRLFAIGGYRADTVSSAPLQVLGGAAGRGVLLEFSAADLASDGLPDRLAEALQQLASEGGLGNAR